MADFNSNLKEITELKEELIKPVENKQEEIIPLLALAPLIISGIATAAITGGVIAD